MSETVARLGVFVNRKNSRALASSRKRRSWAGRTVGSPPSTAPGFGCRRQAKRGVGALRYGLMRNWSRARVGRTFDTIAIAIAIESKRGGPLA